MSRQSLLFYALIWNEVQKRGGKVGTWSEEASKKTVKRQFINNKEVITLPNSFMGKSKLFLQQKHRKRTILSGKTSKIVSCNVKTPINWMLFMII